MAKRTQTVYSYIKDYISREGFAPSIREVAEACQCGAATVLVDLAVLEAQGLISRRAGKARGLVLVKGSKKGIV